VTTSSTNRVVWFRFDADPEIGIGHALRCLTLAEALRLRGHKSIFFVNQYARKTASFLESCRFEIVVCKGLLPSGNNNVKPDLVVFDHYGISAREHQVVQSDGIAVLAIDDLADRPLSCDILLDQTFGRTREDYGATMPKNARMLLGSKYGLLRPQFAKARRKKAENFTFGHDQVSAFVSFGGTDIGGLTLKSMIALKSRGINAHVVVGRSSPNLKLIVEHGNSSENSQVHVDCDDVATVMAQCGFAIGAGGTSSWERCCMGLPTILAVVADNQVQIARNLERNGAVSILKEHSIEGIQQSVDELLSNEVKLKQMKIASEAICDGNGTKRVVDTLENFFDRTEND
jgi:UDP-2,4-diacetamido-2,4,6-trideoxy-beta-L-altropyranose hydrolase